MRARRVLTAACLLVGVLSAHPGAWAGSEPQRPNFVILFADDLGYGDLASYGHPLIRTPHLDRMAREGVRLTSFYSAAPSCTPSRAALLTGRYPQRVGLPHVLGPESEQGIPAGTVTLAELLKARGYRTAAFGKWHLGHARPEFLPTGKGFDEYHGLLYSNDMIRPWVQTDRPLEVFRNERPLGRLTDQSGLTDTHTEEAIRFLESAAPGPFLLYVAYSMPHVPLSVTRSRAGRSRAGLYGDVIESIDDSVGRILTKLRELGLDRQTLVLFTSDNGPWLNMPDRMFSGNMIQPWDAGSPGLLRGAKATTWEGGQRVPAIFRWPGRLPAGAVRNDTVSALDVMPTLARLAGAPASETPAMDGTDVFPYLSAADELPDRPFFYVLGWNVQGVRRGPWKLRLRDGFQECNDPAAVDLFHLDLDPGERYDRSASEPGVVRSLCSELVAFQGEVAGMRGAPGD